VSSKGDTPVSHRSLLYWAQDSSRRVAHQSPPVDGEKQISPITHFRMQIVRELWNHPTRGADLGPYGRTHVVVRRGPGIGSHFLSFFLCQINHCSKRVVSTRLIPYLQPIPEKMKLDFVTVCLFVCLFVWVLNTLPSLD